MISPRCTGYPPDVLNTHYTGGKHDYPEYAWSLPRLDRRMRYFDITKYINYETTVDEVVAASNTENDGPGQLLGYRALHKKLREQHGLAVPHVFFLPTQRDQSSWVGRQRHDDGKS